MGKDYNAAIKDCNTAVEIDPKFEKAYFRLATCLTQLGQLTDDDDDDDVVFVEAPPDEVDSKDAVKLDVDVVFEEFADESLDNTTSK